MSELFSTNEINADVEWAVHEAQVKTQERSDFIAAIRAMATFLEDNPQVELPYSLTGNVYAQNAEHARTMTHLSGLWSKRFNDYNASYDKTFLPPRTYGVVPTVGLSVVVEREQVCRKIVTGVKHVEAHVIEAHDEEIVEWECSDKED
jgi:hypothetical protein